MFSKSSKGQSSVEVMVILAVGLVILIAIIAYSNTSLSEIQLERQQQIALTSVNDLINAANDVYRQGEGARKRVFFSVPSAIDPSKSGIEGTSIVFNVAGSDIYAKGDANLVGTIPLKPGEHRVWVEAKEGYVVFGLEEIYLDKTSLFVHISRGGDKQETITIYNDGDGKAQVSLVKNWSHTHANFDINTSSFELEPGSSKTLDINFYSDAFAAGAYPGSLVFTAITPNQTHEIFVPVTIEVSATIIKKAWLELYPEQYPISILAGSTQDINFYACNVGMEDLNSVTLSISMDRNANSWISLSPSNITPLVRESCMPVKVTMAVPNDANGIYTGTVYGNSSVNSDSSVLIIKVLTLPEEDGELYLFPDYYPLSIFKGSTEDVNIYACNLGLKDLDDVNLLRSMERDANDWVSISPTNIAPLQRGACEPVKITISVPQDANGDYNGLIEGLSSINSDTSRISIRTLSLPDKNGFLSLFPERQQVTIFTMLPDSAQELEIFACNTGFSPLQYANFSYQVFNDPNNLISISLEPSSLGVLQGGDCNLITVRVDANKNATGQFNANITGQSNANIDDSNLSIKIATYADMLNFSWSPACISSSGGLEWWTFWNSYPVDLNLIRMKVDFNSNAKVASVSFFIKNQVTIYDGKKYFDENGVLKNGKAPPGAWFPIKDGGGFVIESGEVIRSQTSKITFDGTINSNDVFTIHFMFSDGSILTTPPWPIDYKCG
ncbi:MAG: hypothetical protein QW400_00240 [Candidatus Diapherotrites archaeon]